MTKFTWRRDAITDELKIAVGSIILDWALIDDEITTMLSLFWTTAHPNAEMPISFDRRIDELLTFGKRVYEPEPSERVLFCWFVQRVKSANGLRDAIAHGQPGEISTGKKTYVGLMVPKPSRKTKYVPFPVGHIKKLAKQVDSLQNEARWVNSALGQTKSAYDPNVVQHNMIDGVWTRLTIANRSPMLPRWVPPPNNWICP